MRPLRVLQAVTLSERGGAQRHVADLTRGLVERGHEVHVAAGAGGPLFDEVARAGATAHLQTRLVRAIAPRADVAAGRDLVRLVRSLRPDVVHAHSSKAGLLARTAARRCGVPSVFTAHGFVFLEPLPRLLRLAYLVSEVAGGRIGSALIAVSEADARAAVKYRLARPARVELVPNGYDPPQPPPPFPGGETFRLASIANPYRTKGLHVLLGALRDPVLRGVPLEVVVAGDGPELPRLREAAAGLPVEFRGRVDDVFEVLRPAHACVQPSLKEGWPYAVMEAMAAARAVVATNVGGIPDQLGGSECGWIVPPNDPGALARAIADAVEHPDEAERRGRSGRARLERLFTVDAMVDAVEAVYARVLAAR